ncbi:carboxypeptidase-like regulatory domain-containing protein [Spirosoma rhododendri]|uniref:Carboxypeptidase-like regulatory domain-containing protein n=1 Tax=Spirosoma rhododendri TaxID=2728024 RepID=A0A7L5DGJ3_9BACT|nr:carboxypeptidase-like regulatory domain-containing protein [Spirosoma rhododendri]QJD77364.1 carboxypeptidase-like regulatory domain-containing protein [Spirosoma rhododendri]
MASSSVRLTIPSPCTQPWQAMTPDQQGRFCAHCQKTVVDFTGMTDAQLVAFLSTPSRASGCGRLRADQLNRALATPTAGKPGRWQWLSVLLSGWLSSQMVQAQTEAVTDRHVGSTFIPALTTKKTGTISPDTASQGLMIDGTMILKGRIIDATSRAPVAGATVVIKNTVYGATTDLAGRFRLTGPAVNLDSTVQLVASSIAYINQELTLTAYMAGQPLLFALREDTEALNQVIYAGEYVVKKPTIWRRIRNLFRR